MIKKLFSNMTVDKWFAVCVFIGVVVIAGFSFWTSANALIEAAEARGASSDRSIAYPIMFDLGVVVLGGVNVYATLMGLDDLRKFAFWSFVPVALITIFLNWTHSPYVYEWAEANQFPAGYGWLLVVEETIIHTAAPAILTLMSEVLIKFIKSSKNMKMGIEKLMIEFQNERDGFQLQLTELKESSTAQLKEKLDVITGLTKSKESVEGELKVKDGQIAILQTQVDKYAFGYSAWSALPEPAQKFLVEVLLLERMTQGEFRKAYPDLKLSSQHTSAAKALFGKSIELDNETYKQLVSG